MFDYRDAIAGFLLWLLFGFLSSMVSCDLQRFMQSHLLFRHFVGLVSFFFLFTVIDANSTEDIVDIWVKTFSTYFIVLVMMKAKWYFTIPLIVLIVFDQSIKFHINKLTLFNLETDQINVNINSYIYTRKINEIALFVITLIGFIHYMVRQYYQYSSDFSFIKLLFSHDCILSEYAH